SDEPLTAVGSGRVRLEDGVVAVGLAGRGRVIGVAEVAPVHRVQPAGVVAQLVAGPDRADIGEDHAVAGRGLLDQGVEEVDPLVDLGVAGGAQADAYAGVV